VTCRSVTLRAASLLPISTPAIADGCIRIMGGRIAWLGPSRDIRPTVDLGNAIILPGLVNAHTHLEFSHLPTAIAPDGGLPAWIRRVVQARRARDAGADPQAAGARAIELGLAESAAAGVTTIGDIATFMPATPLRGGPRVRVFREALGLATQAGNASLRGLRTDLDRLHAQGNAAGVSPHAPYSVAAGLGGKVLALARCRRLPAAMHIAESLDEESLYASGKGPFRELLAELGAWPDDGPRLLSAAEWISQLARGPRGIVVHGTHLDRDPDALARLARHRDRLSVAVCPRTTRRLADRLPPLGIFREAGIRVAIGTDSRASNPDLSVLAECRTLVDAGLASPAEALTMATQHGGFAVMFDRCGRLAPGLPADLVVLRPAASGHDPYAAALDPGATVLATVRAGRLIHVHPDAADLLQGLAAPPPGGDSAIRGGSS
jgi:cytosine/adenosine deaminase-related metal-dependent hydrolase